MSDAENRSARLACAVIVTVVFLATLGMSLRIAPLQPAFESMNVTLPWLVDGALATAQFFLSTWWLFAIAAVLFIGLAPRSEFMRVHRKLLVLGFVWMALYGLGAWGTDVAFQKMMHSLHDVEASDVGHPPHPPRAPR